MKYAVNASLTTYDNTGGNDVSMGVNGINIGVNEENSIMTLNLSDLFSVIIENKN